ncbi:hypothetical protein [Endozoicomonas sp. ISHI1]|uniref:hypothetical protein n=1 Tax=Endozoicomonas sp. ISHI1 TaxID=2825882 RepID=UPI002148A6E7|nr:hypothetical protein [Endozoicomonas sp. ISHI1]
MSFGLTPTSAAKNSTTPQPQLYSVAELNSETTTNQSALKQEVTRYVSSAEYSHAHAQSGPNIRDRRATSAKVSFAQAFQHPTENTGSANTPPTGSINDFNRVCEQIIKDCPDSRKDDLTKAFQRLKSLMENAPPSSEALLQMANCLRMIGKSEQECEAWFEKALVLAPSVRQKNWEVSFSQNNESAILQILRGFTEQP